MHSPKHCSVLKCQFSGLKKFVGVTVYVCTHPNGVLEEPSVVEYCPKILKKLKMKDFCQPVLNARILRQTSIPGVLMFGAIPTAFLNA